MLNLASVPTAFINQLIGAADAAIKTYLKRDPELRAYVEYYNGNATPNLIVRQFPVLSARTTIAAGSDGATLPQSTIYVESTEGFDTGTGADPDAEKPAIAVQTGTSTWTTVRYTGVTATSFTGCTGGTGTLSTTSGANGVATPVLFFDQQGYYGQNPNGFGSGTQLSPFTQYMVKLDKGGRSSYQGLIQKVGGAGAGFWGFYYPENVFSGKLAGYKQPYWPRGDGNIKLMYSAGYAWNKLPQDLVYACSMLAAYMVRIMPSGQPLSSESLGAYSYSILQGSVDIPELGSLPRTLAPYREVSFPGGI